jgi:peptide deformylase
VAQNRHGKKIKVAGSGLLSRAMQHEIDHLHGKLYIDYLESMDDLIPVSQLGNEDDEEAGEALKALA